MALEFESSRHFLPDLEGLGDEAKVRNSFVALEILSPD